MNGQTDREDQTEVTAGSRVSQETTVERRRRLLKAGLSATPILMSLSSRSVFAGKSTRPSGFCSMKVGTSSPGNKSCYVSGKTPSTWCSQAESTYHGWPSGCYPKTVKYYGSYVCTATKCKDLFGSLRLSDKTCYDVMRGAVGSADDFDKWCIAARLNARAGLTSGVCEESDVQAMWTECNSKGYYEPMAGQKWSKADCIAYLKSTC